MLRFNMQSFYIKTKFFTPNIGAKLVRRERLLDKLTDGISAHHPLLLITAPAGYGKTTLAQTWVESVNTPVAWYSLDREDSNPWQFWKYLLSAISLALPEISDHLQSVSHTKPQHTAEFVIKLLVSEIAETRQPLIIVLDDYHLIESPMIDRHVALLVRNLPKDTSLILTSRRIPNLPVSSLRARGQLTEITAEELRFTDDETESYLRLNTNLIISPEQISQLDRKLEGWVVGLQMTAASVREDSALERFLEKPDKEQPQILDYLSSEVLSSQSRDVLDFLCTTSIPDQICASLASSLLAWTIEQSQDMLESLERNNLFIFPLDQNHTWYRYHPLFLDLLRNRIKSDESNQIPALHKRACDWFEQHGIIDLAVQHGLFAADLNRAFDLVERNAEALILVGKCNQYLQLVDQLPTTLRKKSPTILVYQAVAMVFNEYPHRSIQEVLEQIKGQVVMGDWEGEVDAIQGIIHNYNCQPEIGIELSRNALKKIPQNHVFFRNLVERNLGVAYSLISDIDNSNTWFEKLLQSSKKLNDWGGMLAAYNYLTYFRKIQGRLFDAADLYGEALSFIEEKSLELIPHSIRIIAGYGQLLLQWNRIDNAKQVLKRAIQLARKTNSLYAHSAYQDLSEALLRENDLRGALLLIQELRSMVQEQQNDYFNVQFQHTLAIEALIQLEAGRVDLADSWLVSSGFELYSLSELVRKFGLEFGRILPIAAKVYCARGKPEMALRILETAIPHFRRQGTQSYLIQALSAAAAAYHQAGQDKDALRLISEAVILAEPEENIGAFLVAGIDLSSLLCEIPSNFKSPHFIQRLLTILSGVEHSRRISSNDLCLVDPLSQRELEVLHLFNQGMNNREIAVKLYLSINTVKSHSIKIYRKLNVKSRNQAISKARLLGILPNQGRTASKGFRADA